MNRATYAWVCTAAAEIPCHGVIDVLVGRVGCFRKERRRAHDLANLAVTALGNVFGDPGALERMGTFGRETFNGRHGPNAHGADGDRAGSYRLPIKMHRAGTAEPGPAAVLGSGEVEDVPEDPEEGHVGRNVDAVATAVDQE